MSYAQINAVACACVGIKPTLPSAWLGLNNPVQKEVIKLDTTGLYHYDYVGSEGLELDCYLEYEKAERDTRDCPGQPESINLIYALHKGEDISEVLSDDVVALIEEGALASMEMDKWNEDYDRGKERYNDMAEAA